MSGTNNPLNAVVLSGTDYSPAATISLVYGGRGGAYVIENASVYLELQYSNDSLQGSESWSPEMLVRPGLGTIPSGAIGVRFRNASALSPATIIAGIQPPGFPLPNPTALGPVSAATQIATLALASFPPSDPQDGDSLWLILPSTYDPVGGKQVRWLVTYNATDAVWDVAGPPLYSANEANEPDDGTATAAYRNLTTVGPQITIPRGGDYLVGFGAQMVSPTGTNGPFWVAVDYGAGATDAEGIRHATPTQAFGSSRAHRFKTLTTAQTLTLKYRTESALAAVDRWQARWLSVQPVRIT